jgi:hypothetical protein
VPQRHGVVSDAALPLASGVVLRLQQSWGARHMSSHRKPVAPVPSDVPAEENPHERHCFVVMPFGRDSAEKRWFKGWYEAVIKPAVEAAGYEPILSAAEDQPGAINDEIRAHLVFDSMVVVDLGGRAPENSPNPNVMYELGLRHAFGLPTVVMAWEGQTIPFDVSNQRAILSQRDFLDIEPTRFKLETFIKAAASGKFYNPMTAVGREAAIDAAAQSLDEGSVLAILAEEIRELKEATVASSRAMRPPRPLKVRYYLTKPIKSELWLAAQEMGFDSVVWTKFLTTNLEGEEHEQMRAWEMSEWIDYLKSKAPNLLASAPPKAQKEIDDDFLSDVYAKLPEQPWPTGVHRMVAEKLNVAPALVQKAMQELIAIGLVHDQKDGVVMVPLKPDALAG